MMISGAFKVQLYAFHQEVTGSRILVEILFPNGIVRRILVDCGYCQEIDYQRMNYIDDLDPKSIDAILITHNHIDHTGLLPKFVRNGFSGPIYMTEQTKELCPTYLRDACNRQQENANQLKKRFPNEAKKFHPLFFMEDVQKTQDLIIGVRYNRSIEIFPGIEVTFYENAHILGASMILLRCKYYNLKDFNFFFTGDYRLENKLYHVTPIPEEVRKLPIIMVHESTYGSTNSTDIKKCHLKNCLISFLKRQTIVEGAFTQGRLQERLYELKCWDEAGWIPKEYKILVVTPLGEETTKIYQRILHSYNPKTENFLPERAIFVSPNDRETILDDSTPKVILMSSGMLSNGPARTYIPYFVERSDVMIHLIGYAAKGTFARTLLDAKREATVAFNGQVLQKRAIVKTTREKTSHATADEMIGFINQFKNIQFLGINHGEKEVKQSFQERVNRETKAKRVEMLNPDNMFVFYQNTPQGADYDDILVKKATPEYPSVSPHLNNSKRTNSKGKNSRRGRKRY